MRRDIFQAIADPTRRQIIGLLAGQSLNLNTVAGHFQFSRPAISRHMRILSECGIVVVRPYGRERYCHANIRKLKEVDDWMEKYRSFWNIKLDALDKWLEKKPGKRAQKVKTKRQLK